MEPKTKNKTQIAYEYILSRIESGVYGPGYRIIIDQIARELSLSSIPVREAIRQLEAEGWIQYKPYTGAIVSNINEKEYLETLSVLAVLEGYATALSSSNMKEGMIQQLAELNKKMEQALHEFDFEQFSELNYEFHALIYKHCGNAYLEEQIKQIWQRMKRIRAYGFTFVPQRARESIKEHEEIIRLLKEQAPRNEIEDFVRQHKLNTAEAFKNR
ncbi:GntR family transcriptional regulator [Parageobacillus thermoglucosidasius]|uniref:GntR family transcriptional regulator n=2 Tax=Anoxybacillaceae TaxID=3120669 RepID=A0AAN0YKW8_PARTM|nr:GntR family transcriptional regulator [Parageobacillus thermoglucosidasius]AEH46550.1 transcriptional regulator, GntR family [Parageobacillus thermoglucosidasius C56-YS93]ALF08649.1 GntR family transcriptional regulator [Parageobacillus thermoglucosidasius]ANZ28733.1 GntR family transcriptional regulator [Parageobacillus thermoglucosidasius]APM79470.1 GntR family transcriptional regulator [Parageobacillus thermoglucosidasius]KJX68666.1 GntR family transcriptional regulator [Parageobacillus 